MKPSASRKCAACSEWILLTDFSKNQRSKGDLGRCSPCIMGSNKNEKQPAHKKQKGTPNITCLACQQQKKPTAFPKESQTTCVACIVDRIPRTCKGCYEAKPKDQYILDQWNKLPRSWQQNNHSNKTTQEIQSKVARDLMLGHRACLACVKAKQEKQKQAAKDREAKRKRMGVTFYDWDHPVPKLQYKQAETSLAGTTYDILFHHGFNRGEQIENRTTKGTVTFHMRPREREPDDIYNEDSDDKEEEATTSNGGGELLLCGNIAFSPDMRQVSEGGLLFQNDFRLFNGKVDDDGSDWECRLQARMIEEDAIEIVHIEGGAASAYLKCIQQRAAIPWMKYEEEDYNSEGADKVQFETLQEAEALAQAHQSSCFSWMVRHKELDPDIAKKIHGYASCKPEPVFFLETGDLILQVCWSDDHGGSVDTEILLRQRKSE